MTASALGAASPSQFVLQVLALITGGGIIQFSIFLLRRRSELAALDRTSSEPLLKGQGDFIDRLVESEKQARGRLAALEEQQHSDSKDFAERVRLLDRENKRLSAELARVRTDLDIARGQVAELRRLLRMNGEP